MTIVRLVINERVIEPPNIPSDLQAREIDAGRLTSYAASTRFNILTSTIKNQKRGVWSKENRTQESGTTIPYR